MEPQVKKFNFIDTTARRKVWEMKKRLRAVKGGTSASKTISIIEWHIDYCQQKRQIPEISTIASESFPHLNLGAIRDFKAIMKDRGYWRDDLWNITKSTYTFETGNMLEFMSVDTYGKAHGPRRDTLYLNECNNLSWIIVDQLIIRTRKIVWMDWNPTQEFWFHEQLLPYRPDDIDYLTLTYKDNEGLDEISIQEIESHKHNKRWWKVYGLGEDGETEGQIYTNWIIIDEVPEDAVLKRKGLDFGYTNDPSALVDIYKWNNGYVVDELLYRTGMKNPDIAKTIGESDILTIADSSEPKSIAEIAEYGVNIIGAKKGKGSLSHGIDTVQSKTIYVTKRSLNVIKEYRNYHFIVDDAGKTTNDPEDVMNHAMDAIRYAIADLHPKRDEISDYKQPEYEKPTIGATSAQTTVATIGTGTRQDLMKRIMSGRKSDDSSFESDKPWQRPGIQ